MFDTLQSLQVIKIEGGLEEKPMCFYKGVKSGRRTTINSSEFISGAFFRIVLP